LINIEKSKNDDNHAGFIFALAPLVAYPVAIHAAIINGHTLTALLMLLAAPVLLASRSRSAGMFAVLITAAFVILLAMAREDIDQQLLYLMPVLLNFTLAVIFGRTLLPGETPLITRFAILLSGRLEPRVVSYTRQVTRLWTLFFVLLALESLLLALFAPLEIWSLFVNVLNYLLAGLLFAGEYFFRIRHLDDVEHTGFFRFVRNLSRVTPRAFNKQ